MAKPRIFVSSTYYDLKHIRNGLESFISQFGYESVLFESGDIPFEYTQPLDESCYHEIESCHMLVLIIGGRYGSQVSETSTDEERVDVDALYQSITKKEYETARSKDIPIYIFVEKAVMAEFQTYKENKKNTSVNYAHVDSVGVFVLLEEIIQQRRNNLIREFEKIDDITSWLQDQWAGLFAEFLSKKSAQTTLRNLSSQVDELRQLSDVLKSYNESIIKAVEPDGFEDIISKSDLRLKKAKIRNFAKESLIDYLLRKENTKLSLEKVYDAFEKSVSVEDFLEKAGFSFIFRKRFLYESLDKAREDYDYIDEKYFITFPSGDD